MFSLFLVIPVFHWKYSRGKLVLLQQLLLESSNSLFLLLFPHFTTNSSISYLPLVFLAVKHPNLAVVLLFMKGVEEGHTAEKYNF